MYPTEVIIHLDALRRNFQDLQRHAGECALVPVIKSDAYGHGLTQAGIALLSAGAKRLAVFRLEEALALRQAGVTAPVWVLLGALPQEAEKALAPDLRLACPHLEIARALSEVAAQRRATFHLHLTVDTGMGRLGFLPGEVPAAIAAISALPGLRLCGVFSHLAKAEDGEHPVTKAQIAHFKTILPTLPPSCQENHLCASTAWLNRRFPELPFARPGICLYAPATDAEGRAVNTRSVMTLRTRLISVKDMPAGSTISYNCLRTLDRPSRVAVAPLGYDDGYLRHLSNSGSALVRGQHAPILGTVCMSMIMLDVTDIPGAALDDEAVFLGRQGDQEITVHALAARAGTTPHEILCAIGHAAAHRIYAD
ncbi:MAG TPA: alanine racemase [Lentisphaeria bacterium]|nr:alanine racemase [Lentisphaeria bacterium]